LIRKPYIFDITDKITSSSYLTEDLIDDLRAKKKKTTTTIYFKKNNNIKPLSHLD
jgi:hypothetical protein